MSKLIDKVFYRAQERISTLVVARLRKAALAMQGLEIGDTRLPRSQFTWPHKVRIGNDCRIEDDVYFKHDGIWSPDKSIVIGDRVFLGRGCEFNVRKLVKIGNDCLVASHCKFIDHDHGFGDIHAPMNVQEQPEAPIVLEGDVWLGVNVVVLKGVTIGRGAIVGAGAVVTRSIPPLEIWGGIPARKIGSREERRP